MVDSVEALDEIDRSNTSTLTAMLLVAGTCIGGGMLALPLTSGFAGFWPSLCVMLLCWLTMTATGLLLLEASLWMDEGCHYISMAQRFLGMPGRVVAWILYLFVGYGSVVAYTAGGGEQIAFAVEELTGVWLGKTMSSVAFLTLFGMIIYGGGVVLGRINTLLFFGMLGAYVLLVGMGLRLVDVQLLMHQQWAWSWLPIPLFLTAFSFQSMVPSLPPMLRRDPKALRWAVLGGSTLALGIYSLWQCVILGIIPAYGESSLAQAFTEAKPATYYLKDQLGTGLTYYIAEYFAFFALVTSFLGIGLGLFDFLADGLRIRKTPSGKLMISLFIAVPTLFFALNFERAFLVAMDSTGGYGDSILSGILPVMMVWVGRYRMGLTSSVRLPGGRIVLVLIGLFFTGVLAMELGNHMGWLPTLLESAQPYLDSN